MADRFHGNIQPSLDLDEHEHLGQPGDDGAGAKRVVAIPALPDSPRNGSISLEYTGDNLTKITKTIDGVDYEKTLTYTNGKLTGTSAWVRV